MDVQTTQEILENVTRALSSIREETWRAAIEAVPANICPLPEQYGDKCENCDGILEPESCRCEGYSAARTALIERALKDGVEIQ